MSTVITPPSAPASPVRASLSAVEVDVQLEPLDLYRAERTLVWRHIRLFLYAATIFVLLRALTGEGLFLLVAVAVMGLFCFAIHSAFIYMGARSTLKTNRVLGGPIHYTFEPGGIFLRASTFWSHTAWSNLHDTLETRHALILRTSSAQKYVLPKRCLAPGDLERLRALAGGGASNAPAPRPQAKQVHSSRLTISIRMTADDLYRGFLILLLRKSYWYAGQIAFSLLLVFALNPRWLSPIAFVVVGSIFFFYVAVALYWSSARAIRTNAIYRNELLFAFDESGLDTFGPTFCAHHEWSNFQAVMEDSKIFTLCPSNSQMVIVPKRCFAAVSQIEALRQLLRTHFSGKLSLKH